MDGLRREAASGLSTSGLQQDVSQQVLRESGSVSEGEEQSEGANLVVHEMDSHARYIAIQRNSKYYRSMRLPSRGKRKPSREAMHIGCATGEY